MADERAAAPTTGAAPKPAAAAGSNDDAYAQLRRVAAVGWQLRAAVHAGDRFITQDGTEDRNTGVWLISCAVSLAEDIKTDLDGLARTWKPRAVDAALSSALHKLRTRAHQLHAATRAADHFLDQDAADDRSTGSWLVACALGLADKLAGETDDLASALKRSLGDAATTTVDAAPRRAANGASLRGVVA